MEHEKAPCVFEENINRHLRLDLSLCGQTKVLVLILQCCRTELRLLNSDPRIEDLKALESTFMQVHKHSKQLKVLNVEGTAASLRMAVKLKALKLTHHA